MYLVWNVYLVYINATIISNPTITFFIMYMKELAKIGIDKNKLVQRALITTMIILKEFRDHTTGCDA